ncbi:hypothetical protein TWF106_003580 [Orbilia oligospora]|uniref:Nephrocystin 3-like N-terminal domain-containing protein n=1 Tax=Orbilia oligospora TaxID=2813651 RepID=A0A7C8QUE2_ORBOL|nr:hypothetical protein TWF106_003580 [Orbilia oligospora]
MASKEHNHYGDISGDKIFIGDQRFKAENIYFGPSNKDKCLEDLYSAECDPFAIKERLADQAELINESLAWIFQNKTFKSWFGGESHQILRITAGPGKGKTMTMIGIINHLEATITPAGKCDVCYFLCLGEDARLGNPAEIMKALLHQILTKKSNENLRRHLSEPYSQRGSKILEGQNAYILLRKILMDIIVDSRADKLYFLIDGLDECQNFDILLEFIKNTTISSKKVYWLVASRNLPRIEEFFNNLDQRGHPQLIIRFEDCDEEINFGITKYILRYVNALDDYYDEESRNRIFNILSKKSKGTYLWIKFACKALKLKPTTSVEELDKIPTELTQIYGKIEEALSGDKYWNIMLLIIHTATVALRPLRLGEMMVLIKYDSIVLEVSASGKLGLIKKLIQCSSFLTLRDGSIHFIHHTVREHFENRSEVALRHKPLYQNCLRIFRGNLRSRMSDGIREPVGHLEYACCHWGIHFLSYLRNTADNWGDAEKEEVREQISEFLRHDLLNWATALGSLRKVAKGIAQLAEFEETSHFNSRLKDVGCTNRILEARKFLSDQRSLLEEDPLYIHSGVLFCPKNSAIKTAYKSKIPSWIKKVPHTTYYQDQCFHVFEGFKLGVGMISPDAVALSPNAETVAVGFNGSKKLDDDWGFLRETIQIWDVASGACMLSIQFRGDEVARRLPRKVSDLLFKGIGFIGGGQKLVVVSGQSDELTGERYEDIFSRFDVATGNLEVLFTFLADKTASENALGAGRRSTSPASLLLSPNCQHCVGFEAESREIFIFKTDTESNPNPIHLSHGHLNCIEQIVFSPDSEIFATISKNFDDNSEEALSHRSKLCAEVRIWDVKTAALRHTIRPFLRHYIRILFRLSKTKVSMRFSHDGEFLAILAANSTFESGRVSMIEMWKPSSGEFIGPICFNAIVEEDSFSFLRSNSVFVCTTRSKNHEVPRTWIFNICDNGGRGATTLRVHQAVPQRTFAARLSDSHILCQSKSYDQYSRKESSHQWLVWDLENDDTIHWMIPATGDRLFALSEAKYTLAVASQSGLSLWNTKDYPTPISSARTLWESEKYGWVADFSSNPQDLEEYILVFEPGPNRLDQKWVNPKSLGTGGFIDSSLSALEIEMSKSRGWSLVLESSKMVFDYITDKYKKNETIFRRHGATVSAHNISNDQTKVVTAGEDICIWGVENQELQQVLSLGCNEFHKFTPRATCVSFSRDDRLLFVWSETVGKTTGKCSQNFHIYDLCEPPRAGKSSGPRQGWNIEIYDSSTPVTVMAISPDNLTIIYIRTREITASRPEYETAIGCIRLKKLESRTKPLWEYASLQASPY